MESKAKFEAVKANVALLCELYPHCFFILPEKRRPLQIGIHHQLVGEGGVGGNTPVMTAPELKNVLRFYVQNIGYLRAGARPGAMRVALDGADAGLVTDSERDNYQKSINAIEAKLVARKAERLAVKKAEKRETKVAYKARRTLRLAGGAGNVVRDDMPTTPVAGGSVASPVPLSTPTTSTSTPTSAPSPSMPTVKLGLSALKAAGQRRRMEEKKPAASSLAEAV